MKIYTVVVGYEDGTGFVEWEQTEKIAFEDFGDAAKYVLSELKLDFCQFGKETFYISKYEKKKEEGIDYAYIIEHDLIKAI